MSGLCFHRCSLPLIQPVECTTDRPQCIWASLDQTRADQHLLQHCMLRMGLWKDPETSRNACLSNSGPRGTGQWTPNRKNKQFIHSLYYTFSWETPPKQKQLYLKQLLADKVLCIWKWPMKWYYILEKRQSVIHSFQFNSFIQSKRTIWVRKKRRTQKVNKTGLSKCIVQNVVEQDMLDHV